MGKRKREKMIQEKNDTVKKQKNKKADFYASHCLLYGGSKISKTSNSGNSSSSSRSNIGWSGLNNVNVSFLINWFRIIDDV